MASSQNTHSKETKQNKQNTFSFEDSQAQTQEGDEVNSEFQDRVEDELRQLKTQISFVLSHLGLSNEETTYEETLPENKKEFDQNNLQVSNPNTERVALSNGSVEGKLQRAKKRIRDLENQMKQALLKIEQLQKENNDLVTRLEKVSEIEEENMSLRNAYSALVQSFEYSENVREQQKSYIKVLESQCTQSVNALEEPSLQERDKLKTSAARNWEAIMANRLASTHTRSLSRPRAKNRSIAKLTQVNMSHDSSNLVLQKRLRKSRSLSPSTKITFQHLKHDSRSRSISSSSGNSSVAVAVANAGANANTTVNTVGLNEVTNPQSRSLTSKNATKHARTRSSSRKRGNQLRDPVTPNRSSVEDLSMSTRDVLSQLSTGSTKKFIRDDFGDIRVANIRS